MPIEVQCRTRYISTQKEFMDTICKAWVPLSSCDNVSLELTFGAEQMIMTDCIARLNGAESAMADPSQDLIGTQAFEQAASSSSESPSQRKETTDELHDTTKATDSGLNISGLQSHS